MYVCMYIYMYIRGAARSERVIRPTKPADLHRNRHAAMSLHSFYFCLFAFKHRATDTTPDLGKFDVRVWFQAKRIPEDRKLNITHNA